MKKVVIVIFFLLFSSLYATSNKTESELQTMLQVFLYKGDLEDAYKVALLGYKQNKNSYYWNQKLAQVCQWTGRTSESMKYLQFMYKHKYDPKLEKKLIDYGLKYYQYEKIEKLVVHRARKYPTKKNINLMINVFTKIGEPEKVIDVLEEEYNKNPQKKIFLTKALQLSLEIGNLSLAKKYVDILEKHKPYSYEDASLIARYYYIVHNMNKAFESLQFAKEMPYEDKKEVIKYYQLKTDLGWYLQKNKGAALASKALIEMKKGRLVDYERVIFYYKTINPNLSAKYAKKAFFKYKQSSLFYTYANNALQQKRFESVRELIKQIDDGDFAIKNELLYLIIKSRVYRYFKEYKKEKKVLEYALSLHPNDDKTILTLLSYYIEVDNPREVEIILQNLSERENLGFNFYLPMASAYFYLGDVDKASFYTQKLLDMDNPVTKLISFKFLQAYIYQSQNNENAFHLYMSDIVKTLEQKAKKDPGLKTQDQFLSNYLRAAMYVLSAEDFEKKLKEAKKYLKQSNYRDILYSWAVKNHADEKSLKIYHSMKKKALWLIFSNNIMFQNHTKLENLLREYLNSLAVGDAVQTSLNDGQIALSQKVAFDGMLHNQKNQNLYIQYLNLMDKRSNRFILQTSYKNQSPLKQESVFLENRIYFSDAYYFFSGLSYYSNIVDTKTSFMNPPEKIFYINMALQRVYTRGFIQFDIDFYHFIKEYFGYSFLWKHRVSTDINLDVYGGKNKKAPEGVLLFIGGMKNPFGFHLQWSMLQSTYLTFFYEYAKFYAQNNYYLGDGYQTSLSINYTIRNGYPDMKVYGFYTVGDYKEKLGSKGIIDTIQNNFYSVLPQKYYNYGIGFSYGMVNYSGYTRVWRPYFKTSVYYSSTSKDYSYSTSLGYGGKLFNQDHLSFGLNYTNVVNGIGGAVSEFYLHYKFHYK